MTHTLEAVAGYCPATVIYEILTEVLAEMDAPMALLPQNIVLGEDCTPQPSVEIVGARACDESEAAWHFGALASMLSSGRQPYGGRGYQAVNGNTRLPMPTLRREHSMLTPIVRACLNPDPKARPTLAQIAELLKQVEPAITEIKTNRSVEQEAQILTTDFDADDLWPEEI